MKLLLTSGGVTNPSIRNALVEMLGKPIEESSALLIPTASYGHQMCTPTNAWRFISGQSPAPLGDLGWASLGVLELAVLPSLERSRWVEWVEGVDALLVDGGDAAFLAHWIRASGLADLIPVLNETVWVGLSAGSMVMTPRIGDDFVTWKPDGWSDQTLGVVDFSIFPHLNLEQFPQNDLAGAQAWAAEIGGPSYAIDDQSAIAVVDGEISVISEGEWVQFGGPSRH